MPAHDQRERWVEAGGCCCDACDCDRFDLLSRSGPLAGHQPVAAARAWHERQKGAGASLADERLQTGTTITRSSISSSASGSISAAGRVVSSSWWCEAGSSDVRARLLDGVVLTRN
eukprot:1413771-Prymnesium_polylepis.1